MRSARSTTGASGSGSSIIVPNVSAVTSPIITGDARSSSRNTATTAWVLRNEKPPITSAPFTIPSQ